MRALACSIPLAVAALMAFTPSSSQAQQLAQYNLEGAQLDRQLERGEGIGRRDRMQMCNTRASQQRLSGDAHKRFMSECLSGKGYSGSGSTVGNAHQERLSNCNQMAASRRLTGDAHKNFMAQCLGGR